MAVAQIDNHAIATRAEAGAKGRRRAARMGMAGDRLLTVRAALALMLAGLRYWPSVAVHVRREIDHWQRRAEAVEDPRLRSLAIAKLSGERFNAEASAMAATLAPRVHRKHAVQAIVALEVMFDYLDGLTERALADPLRDGERLYAPFIDAVHPWARHSEEHEDDYLRELASVVESAMARLPASEAVAPVARRCAARGAHAQIHMHATATLGTAQLEQWARREARDSALGWREFLAGSACSVLALHALVAAAAEPRTTCAEAERIYAAYLPACALVTLLDGIVDQERDAGGGQLGYIDLYGDRRALANALVRLACQARRECARLHDGAHHVMTLAAAVAYWCSAEGASGELARPLLARLRAELQPLVGAPLLVMRVWRAARGRPHRRGAAGQAPS